MYTFLAVSEWSFCMLSVTINPLRPPAVCHNLMLWENWHIQPPATACIITPCGGLIGKVDNPIYGLPSAYILYFDCVKEF